MEKKRQNRTVIVDFKTKAGYEALIKDGKAYLEFVMAYVFSLGFQFKHQCSCEGHNRFTRHSHYARVRLDGQTIWRIQCVECKAVFTILPHFVMRYRSARLEQAKTALLSTHAGNSLEYASVFANLSVSSIWRLLCALGQQPVERILLKLGLSLPKWLVGDEKHSFCLSQKVYLPTIACQRLIWHCGYSFSVEAEALTKDYGQFQKIALEHTPQWQPEGILIDGFESTHQSFKRLFPQTPIGFCLRHAAQKVATKIKSVESSIRQKLTHIFTLDLFRPPKLAGLERVSLAQRLRRFVDKVRNEAGESNAQAVKQWIDRKKTGWGDTLSLRSLPKTSVEVDQAHNYIDRKLFMMKGFHHPQNSNSSAFLQTLALLYNFVPYQRRAKNAKKSAVEVQGAKLPHPDWLLSLLILTTAGGMIREG